MNKVTLSELIDGAPSEVLLLRFGKTNTSKGPYYFDEESAARVLSVYDNRNIELFFDYNHQSLDPQNPEQGEAAGWFDLALRSDGLWAVDISWTDDAQRRIKEKKYRYISPVLITDENNKVIRLINVALTNLPATSNLTPLTLEEKISINIDKPKLDSITGEKYPMKHKLETLDLTLDHHMALGKHYSEMMTKHADDEDMIEHYGKLHKKIHEMSGLVHEMRHGVDPNSKYIDRDMMYRLSETAQNSSELMLKLKEITGVEDTEKQIGILYAIKDSKENLAKLSEEIAKKDEELRTIKLDIAKAEMDKIVDGAISAKKLLPKQREWALSLSKVQLEAYLSVAPVLSLSEKIIDKNYQ